MLLGLKSKQILAEGKELLNQLPPQVPFLLEPDILLKAGQLFPPPQIICSLNIFKGFFLKLKVFQILIQLSNLLYHSTVLFVENRNVLCNP